MSGSARPALPTFRHVDVDPADPTAALPFEAVQAILDRGLLREWRPLVEQIRADPWGPVASKVVESLAIRRPYGTAELFERILTESRDRVAAAERCAVADEIAELVRRSGLTRAAFAVRIGTSASRMSTYLSGSVTPSAALLLRMRRLVDKLGPRS